MIFIQSNININMITLTREATKNEVEIVYSNIYPWMPQKLPIVYFFTKDCNSAKTKNHRSVSAI